MKTHTVFHYWWLATMLFVMALPVKAIEKTIVFLECTSAEGVSTTGTGVIVSPLGMVLTAKHVASPRSTCRGSIGIADSGSTKRMILQPRQLDVDAALLRFADQGQNYHFNRYCAIEDWMIREKIFVAGFPGTSKTGAASFREGVLSTVIANAAGILETDGQTVQGMSGGPVFSQNLNGLVGIVIGADFDALGMVSHFGILPIADFANEFNLQIAERPCYRQSREKDFTAQNGDWTATWTSGDAPVALEIQTDEGVCFLGGVFGELNSLRDSVEITEQDGWYFLQGNNQSGGRHGGTARCIYY